MKGGSIQDAAARNSSTAMSEGSQENMPDVAGLKLPAARRVLDAAGVAYEICVLRPHGVKKRNRAGADAENEGSRRAEDGGKGEVACEICDESEMRVLRQVASEGVLVLSVCKVSEQEGKK